MPVNPLRLLLRESAILLQDDERTALLKLTMVILRCSGGSFYDPDAPFVANAWEELNGPPTWDSLRNFVDLFAADPENAACMRKMRRLHAARLGQLEDEYRDRLVVDD